MNDAPTTSPLANNSRAQSEEPNPCPFCRTAPRIVNPAPQLWTVECPKCHAWAAQSPNREDAVAAWNAPAPSEVTRDATLQWNMGPDWKERCEAAVSELAEIKRMLAEADAVIVETLIGPCDQSTEGLTRKLAVMRAAKGRHALSQLAREAHLNRTPSAPPTDGAAAGPVTPSR